MDSDHHLIEVEIKGVAVERMKECRKWDEVERKRFKRRMGNVRGGRELAWEKNGRK